MLGAQVSLTVRAPWEFGLAGYRLSGDALIPGDAVESDLGLGLGYGGVTVRRWTAVGGDLRVGLGLLVGAGNAKISLKAIDTRIEADNFGVVEPEVSARRSLAGVLGLRGAVGYRLLFGVNDLPQLAASDLGGFSASLSLSFGPF